MLTGTGFGDDASLAHPLREQGLPEHIVDLVRSGVIEVLALEEDPRATGLVAEPGGLIQRRRAPGVLALESVEFGEVVLVGAHLEIGGGDLVDDRHQRLGHMSSPVHTEVATLVGFEGGTSGQADAGRGQCGVVTTAGLGWRMRSSGHTISQTLRAHTA